MTDPERTMRVFNALGSGAAFLLVTAVAYSIVSCRNIGHRALIWVVLCASGIRAAANFLGAWQVYFHGSLSWDLWVYLVTALSSCVMAAMLFAARADIVTTLRTSEAEELIRRDRIADAQMARWNIEFIDLQLKERSDALLQREGIQP